MKKQNVSNMSVNIIINCCNPGLYTVDCIMSSSFFVSLLYIHMFYPINCIMFYRSTQFHIKLHSTIPISHNII